jgi:hypothetical protein
VQRFLAQHLIPVRLVLQTKADQPHFRAYQVIWTPTLAILDRRGLLHYQAPGFLPPALFAEQLQIGVARAMLAWGRAREAAEMLGPVAQNAASALAPEALYWQGAALYLAEHTRAALMRAWGQLRASYPDSPWAARIPPNQEEGAETW